MQTVVIQIGNTDNKLTQLEWARYVQDMRMLFPAYIEKIHFFGGSATWEEWQNVCFVVICEDIAISEFKRKLTKIRQQYNQDSIAITVGNTEFI